jgi:hypothetical protein
MQDEPRPVDARFAPFVIELEAFAASHNLLVQKYYHNDPQWSFCFEHPLGGQAKLDLRIDEQGAVVLQTVWWVDNYKQFTRSLRWGKQETVAAKGGEIVGALKSALSDVVNWKLGEWTQIADGYKPIWGQMSEERFRSITPQWPKPVL